VAVSGSLVDRVVTEDIGDSLETLSHNGWALKAWVVDITEED
jgi:hypothetical protein